jgi:hypothetical protein
VIANAKDATDRQQAESNKRIAIANLEAQKQIAAIEKVQKLTAEFQKSIPNRLRSFGLRSEATAFRSGSVDSPEVRSFKDILARADNPQSWRDQLSLGERSYYEDQLKRAESAQFQNNLDAQLKLVQNTFQGPGSSSLVNQAIIDLTPISSLEKLNEGQRELAASARESEAKKLEQQHKEETELRKQLKDVLEKLEKSFETGPVVRIVNEAPDVPMLAPR